MLVTTGGPESDITTVVSSWAVVLTIYWLTHIYVDAAERQFDGDTHNLLHRSVRAARKEWVVLLGGMPAMAVFVLFAITETNVFDAARAALFFTMALLAAVGFIGARHAGRGLASAWVEAAGASMLGLLMVVGKTLLH